MPIPRLGNEENPQSHLGLSCCYESKRVRGRNSVPRMLKRGERESFRAWKLLFSILHARRKFNYFTDNQPNVSCAKAPRRLLLRHAEAPWWQDQEVATRKLAARYGYS